MADGRVAEAGTFQKLSAAGGQFATMMKEVQVDEDEREDPKTALAVVAAAPADSGHPGVGEKAASSLGAPSTAGAKLTSEETTAEGSISAAVIGHFVTAMGGSFWLVWLAVSYLVVEVIRVATTVWLSIWTGSTDVSSDDEAADSRRAMFYLVRG